MLDWLANLGNRINDWDLTWVGFRALRPAPEQNMTARVVGLLCLVYCPLSAVIAFSITYLTFHTGGRHAPESVPWVVGAAATVMFLVMQSLLARAWNRRAAVLRAAKTVNHGAHQ